MKFITIISALVLGSVSYSQPLGIINFLSFKLSIDGKTIEVTDSSYSIEIGSKKINQSDTLYIQVGEYQKLRNNVFLQRDSSYPFPHTFIYTYDFGYNIPSLRIYHNGKNMTIYFSYNFSEINTIIDKIEFEEGSFFLSIPCEPNYTMINEKQAIFIKDPKLEHLIY